MKAAFYYGLTASEFKKNGVIIRVKACGVCNTMDLDLIARLHKGPLGIGHE